MSDEIRDPAGTPLTPAEEDQVRRVLADWRPGPETMPADVAARLSAAIEELAADRRTAPAAARSRRRWPNVLVAAAAVSVVALGVGNLIQGNGVDSGDAMSAADAGGAAESARSADKAAPAAPSQTTADAATLPRLHSQTLRRDVARLAAVSPSTMTDGGQDTQGLSGVAAHCTLPPSAKTDRLLLARLDGRLVSVVLDRAEGGSAEARVYSCDDPAAPMASFPVPVE